MIILSLDFETTGLDFEKDRVIEVGAVLYSTGQRKCLESQGYLVQSDVPITEKITEITNITQAALDKFGFPAEGALDFLLHLVAKSDVLATHNGLRFDIPMLMAWCRRLGAPFIERLCIDTMIDIKGHEGKKLTYLAADHGILNLFPHSALADAQTVLTIVEEYDINDVVARAKTPTVIVQAHQSRGQNDLAKAAKFRWNPQHKVWWKPVKETDLDELEKSVQFPIGFAAKEILLDLV